MNTPAAWLAIRLLTLDTFRQAKASGILWIWLTVTALSIVLCLSVGFSGDVPLLEGDAVDRPEILPRSDLIHSSAAVASTVGNAVGQSQGTWIVPAPLYSESYRQVLAALRYNFPIAKGQLTLAFGTMSIEVSRDRRHAVRDLQCILAGGILDSVGLLLVLLWTSGFLPAFLQPQSVMVLLAKPVPRWSLLAGKYLGTLIFVGIQGFVFVAGTWFALGIRTGVWDLEWFVCVPLFLVHFAIFFSFSALLAVLTRNTVASAFGAILFWLICWCMNFARHSARLVPDLENVPRMTAGVEMGYWILPKPLDFHLMLANLLQAEEMRTRVVDLNQLVERAAWSAELSLVTSAIAGIVLLSLAAYEFVSSDY